MASSYRLISSKGSGSALVEAMLALKGASVEIQEVSYEKVVACDPEILSLNPLSELPILILPDGRAMTESAAIAIHLDETLPGFQLLPPPGDPNRAQALRSLVLIAAAIYPTFTYGDDPSDWVSGEAAQAELRAKTDEHRKSLWRMIEREIGDGKWWLGERFSVLDVYVGIMSRWRPRREWFQESCPRLARIAGAVDRVPELAAVWSRNS